MTAGTIKLLVGIIIFMATVAFVYLLKGVISNDPKGPKMISAAEKNSRIQTSVRALLSSPDLSDIGHAQMLIEGMCKDDPIWMLQVLGDFRTSTPTWMKGAPHRDRILVWARSKLKT